MAYTCARLTSTPSKCRARFWYCLGVITLCAAHRNMNHASPSRRTKSARPSSLSSGLRVALSCNAIAPALHTKPHLASGIIPRNQITAWREMCQLSHLAWPPSWAYRPSHQVIGYRTDEPPNRVICDIHAASCSIERNHVRPDCTHDRSSLLLPHGDS